MAYVLDIHMRDAIKQALRLGARFSYPNNVTTATFAEQSTAQTFLASLRNNRNFQVSTFGLTSVAFSLNRAA